MSSRDPRFDAPPPGHGDAPEAEAGAEVFPLERYPVVPSKRPYGWPAANRRHIEGLKWQVWIGFQLQRWRYRGPTLQVSQKRVEMVSGLPQTLLSKLERGLRRIDLAELVAIARAHGKRPKEIAALFTPPSEIAWRHVLAQRVADHRFTDPPSGNPFGGAPPLD